MEAILDFFVTRTWWSYDPGADWFAQPYHAMNLAEGIAWLVFAAFVFGRYLRHRNSPLELLYSLTFVTFGLSDFREAYSLQSWLILLKGLNLAVLLYLRWLIIRRYYPESRTF